MVNNGAKISLLSLYQISLTEHELVTKLNTKSG